MSITSNGEFLEQVRAVRNVLTDDVNGFTVIELKTNKRTIELQLDFQRVKSNSWGYSYKYLNNVYSFCNTAGIITDYYNYTDNVDTLPVNKQNTKEVFNIEVYNID